MTTRDFSVLVVDDEEDIADSVRDVIEQMLPNCSVETADSCAHGIAALMHRPFDAMLVDYKMPDHNGLEFIREARGLGPEVPAILMTGFGSLELASEAINKIHVDGFLAKPLDPAKLAKAVEGAIHRADSWIPDGQTMAW